MRMAVTVNAQLFGLFTSAVLKKHTPRRSACIISTKRPMHILSRHTSSEMLMWRIKSYWTKLQNTRTLKFAFK